MCSSILTFIVSMILAVFPTHRLNLSSLVLLVLCARELSTLPQTISSVSHKFIYLWQAKTISTTRCHQLPHLSHTSTTFSNFQNFLSAFLPWQVHTDKHSNFFDKTLAMVQLEDVSSTGPWAWDLTLPAQCLLSRRLFWAMSGREAAHSAGRSRLVVSKSFTKQCFQAPVAYWVFGPLNMNIISLLICVCYSEAGSALNETKQQYSQNHHI